MRRILAIVLLVLGATSSATAAACTMGSSAAPLTLAAEAGSHRDHHEQDGTASHDSHHSDAGCRLVMACAGAVPVPAFAPSARVASLTSAFRLGADPERWSTVFPAHEPPPPRLSV